jgi:hypothetical protein
MGDSTSESWRLSLALRCWPPADAPPSGTLTQRDRHFSTVVSANVDYPEIHTEAQEHSEAEAKIALWNGIKIHPQAGLVHPPVQRRHYGAL